MSVAQVADSAAYAAKVADGYSAAARYRSIILADSPVAYWRLGDAGLTAVDLTGNGHSGTLHGGVTTGVAGALSGDPDTAMTFDGATGYIEVAEAAALEFGLTSFSLECWLNHGSLPAHNMSLVDKRGTGSPGTNKGWGVGLSATTGLVTVSFDDGTGSSMANTSMAGTAVAAGIWTLLLATFDRTNALVTVLLNGVPKGTHALVTGDVTNAAHPVRIAANVGSLGNFFPGTGDEIVLYGSVLTAAQALNHYNAGVEKVAVLATVRDQAA